MNTDPRPHPPRLARWLLRLRPLGSRRSEVDADLHEAFIERVARVGRGRAARRYYVDVLSVWRWNPSGSRMVRDAMRDLSHGLRVFRHNPGAVAVTVLGLALAIAVSTAVFTFLNVVALREIGVANPSSVVRVHRAWKGGVASAWSFKEYVSLRESSRQTAIETSLFGGARFSTVAPAVGDDTPQTVQVTFVAGTYLGTFGARPLLGRLLSPADDLPGAPPVVVVSRGFWARRLEADPAIIGHQIWLTGVPVTVVGVTARSFTGVADVPPAFWAPLATYPAINGGRALTRESSFSVDIVAMKPATMTIAQAEAQLGAVAAAVGSGSQDPIVRREDRLQSARRSVTGSANAGLFVLVVTAVLTIVGLVVLLACVNVANLQLASALGRQREIGVRLALGATRARVARQLITESLALGLAAGVVGLVVTLWLVPTLAAVVQMPVTVDLAPDLRVYLFLAVVSIAAGIGSGLAPARHGTRGDLMTPLKGDGPRVGASGRPGRLRAALIGVQAAASLVLLVAAALLTRAAVRATHVDLGFDAQHMVTVSPQFRGDEAQTRAYLGEAVGRLRALPGVRAVSLADIPPFGRSYAPLTMTRDGVSYRAFVTRTQADYFSALGLRIVRGRTYTPQEVAAAAPVAVISESAAREFWPDADPIGQSIERFDKSRATIIGIVSDTIAVRLHELRAAAVYWPLTLPQTARIAVRTSGQPETVLPLFRTVLQPLDPKVQLDITLVRDGLQKELDQPRLVASMSFALAMLALGLAVVGIYGVTSFVAGQRTHEIGVRMAVGATTRDVMWLLLTDSLRPVSIGLGAGLILSLLASRILTGILYGIKPRDPVAFAGAAVVLLASTAVAVYIPTRRAARVDPVVVLRQP